MAEVTDTMAPLMVTTMVTGIAIIVVQGVAPVIGDDIRGWGKVSNLGSFPLP
jgi:hypothetical protein